MVHFPGGCVDFAVIGHTLFRFYLYFVHIPPEISSKNSWLESARAIRGPPLRYLHHSCKLASRVSTVAAFTAQYMGADSTRLPLSPKQPLSGYATTAYRRYTLDPRVRCAAGAPNGGKPALRVCAPPTTGARFFTHLMFYLYIRYITFAGDIEFFGVYDTELLFYCSAHFFCRFKTVF